MAPSDIRTVTIVVKADPCLGHQDATTCIPARQTGPITIKSTPSVNVASPTTDPTGGNNSITLTGNNKYLNIDTVASPPRSTFAIPGAGNAILTWRTPSGDGGQPITSYTITVTPPSGKPLVAGSPFTVPVGPHTSFCGSVNFSDCYQLTVSGLQNDSTTGPYTFNVVAVNTVGNSDPGTALATPSVNAKNAVIPTNTSQTLTTCTTASPTSPTCLQYVIPSGSGGVFGAQGNFNLTTGFCGGSNCSSPTGQPANTKNGGVNLGSLAGYLNFKQPILEIITWDFSTFTAFQEQHPTFQNIPVYYEQTGASVAGVLPMCTNQSWALSPTQAASHPQTGSACIKKINVLGSKSNPAANGDIQFQINLTSDSDGLAGHH
jgi:hypothetical protein